MIVWQVYNSSDEQPSKWFPTRPEAEAEMRRIHAEGG